MWTIPWAIDFYVHDYVSIGQHVDGPSTCFSSMPLALIDAHLRLIDNQAAEAAEQIVSIDCRFRRRSRSRMIASFASF